MGIAADVDAEVTALIEGFVTRTSGALCEALVPSAIIAISIYLMFVGWQIIRGHSPDTFPTLLMRSFRVVFFSTIALVAGHYQQIVVDGVTFIQGALVDAIAGAPTLAEVLDDAYLPFINTGKLIMAKAVTGMIPSVPLLIAALIVFLSGAVTLIISLGLYFLAKIALALIFAVGPVFIFCAAFPQTQRFTENWLGQALNYAVLNALIVACVIMLTNFGAVFVERLGAETDTTNVMTAAFALLIACVSLCVVLLNVNNIASALTGGIAIRGIGASVASFLMNPAHYRSAATGARAAATGGQITGTRAAPALPPPMAPTAAPPAFQAATQRAANNPTRR